MGIIFLIKKNIRWKRQKVIIHSSPNKVEAIQQVDQEEVDQEEAVVEKEALEVEVVPEVEVAKVAQEEEVDKVISITVKFMPAGCRHFLL